MLTVYNINKVLIYNTCFVNIKSRKTEVINV